MPTYIFESVLKGAIISILSLQGVVLTSELATAFLPDESQIRAWISGFERLGSFLIVVIFVVFALWGLIRIARYFVSWMERQTEMFVETIADERASREALSRESSEVLRVHTDQLKSMVERQTKELVSHLSTQQEALDSIRRNIKEQNESS